MVRPLIDLPAANLPAPGRAELPAAVPLRRMLGPGVVLLGLSIGSGEFILWPKLVSEFGLVIFWAAVVGVTLQFFLNMEIERYTLATGESAVTGFYRLSKWLGPVFLVCGTVPWIWPGWASGSAEMLTWEVGGSAKVFAMLGLLLCGLVLTLGPVVYRTVETIQVVLVTVIFALAVVLACLLVGGDSIGALARGTVSFGQIPAGVELPMLLGALAFAGAGGTANLAQSNYIKDKGYGMGRFIGRITSPLTGRDEAVSEVGSVFEASPTHTGRWRQWWFRANLEHGLSFFALCLISLALFCLLTHALLGEGAKVGKGLDFIRAEVAAIDARIGGFGRHAFVWTGIIVLLTTEIGILDAVSRVVVDLLAVMFFRGSSRWTPTRLYFVVLWSMIGFGELVLWRGFDEPLPLLILSASLNALVMFLYSGLLLWLGLRCFRAPVRPSLLRIVALLASFGFFGYFSVVTIHDRLSKLFG